MLEKFTQNLKNLLGSKQGMAEMEQGLKDGEQDFEKQGEVKKDVAQDSINATTQSLENSRSQAIQNSENSRDFEEENLSLPTLAKDDEIAVLAHFFAVFSDSTRLKIISALSQNELCVHELTTLLGLKQPTISQHLKALWQARVVSKRKVGLHIFYRCDDKHIEKIYDLACEHIREA